jgi:hypothetical protein
MYNKNTSTKTYGKSSQKYRIKRQTNKQHKTKHFAQSALQQEVPNDRK